MHAEALRYPSTLVTSNSGKPTVPGPLRRYSPTVARPSQIKALTRLPEMTVVWAKHIDTLLAHKAFLSALSERLSNTPGPSKIVFLFETKRRQPEDAGATKLIELFQYFTRPLDLEVAQGIQAGGDAFKEAYAKIVATRSPAAQRASGRDGLDKLKRVIESTADLRAPSGKLSANSVAEVFAMSVAELATLLGRNRQTVSKTPEADSLQPSLRPFERIARLRVALSNEDFRQWLHLANDQLAGRTPLELIREGNADAIADLVEDMLTGSPT
jgi:transcriptional regulator with XRE-family HTH domain